MRKSNDRMGRLIIGDCGEVLRQSAEFSRSRPKRRNVNQGRIEQGGAMTTRRVTGGGQQQLFGEPCRTPGKVDRRREVGFQDPRPEEIFIGEVRLDRYLESMEMGWIVLVRQLRLRACVQGSRKTRTGHPLPTQTKKILT